MIEAPNGGPVNRRIHARQIRIAKGIPPTVIALGLVSLFTDLSSEMIYPLLPVFLSGVLGAGAIALGVIEGVAESTAAFLKVFSGLWTDRLSRRKPLVLAGYGLSSVVRPLIGVAASWPFVLVMRFADRVGKGVRTSPRDALIADVTPLEHRGAAFGLHRSMDHAGAVVGPLVAVGLLSIGVSLRSVFLLSALPAAAVVTVLALGVRESPVSRARTAKPSSTAGRRGDLGRDFKMLLAALIVFTLGNSTDAFLLLRLSNAGIPAASVAALWSLHHAIKMTSAYVGGRFSDRVGRRRSVLCGWLVYAAVYLAFGMVHSPTAMIVVFLAYGLYFGLTEPAERAWIADLVPENLRGTAFGYYHGAVGIAALPASVLFGFVWHSLGASTAFVMGAVLAVLASVLLTRVRPEPRSAPIHPSG